MFVFNGEKHMTLAAEVAEFVTKREQVRLAKEAGKPAPWTDDWILNTYRFCNVRREDDKVTRWLKKHWRDPYAGHENMVAAMVLARMINWPPTLAEIGFPEKWDDSQIINAIHARADRGEKTWTGAYVVTTCGAAMDKAEYVVQTVCGQALGPHYQPRRGDTLAAFWTRLCGIPGLGAGFLAAQVVADLKYCDPHLLGAPDWKTWAASGPGSKRGLNRYYGYAPDDRWASEGVWHDALLRMMNEVTSLLPADTVYIHAQDWQNVMCEFDKYRRVVEEQGRPRSKYKPDDSYHV